MGADTDNSFHKESIIFAQNSGGGFFFFFLKIFITFSTLFCLNMFLSRVFLSVCLIECLPVTSTEPRAMVL